jgi:hypothetical protein
VRRAALFSVIASTGLSVAAARPAFADCDARTSPCVDAEPFWQSPAAVRLNAVSDTGALAAGKVALGTSLTYRLRPAVLNVPAPNQDGRDVNLVKDALSWSLTARLGIGDRLELTALAAGLSQRGAGIKGVTSQAAPAIDSPTLQDPRIGFGYSLATPTPRFGLKLRFEAKLPLGNADALAGERSFVASPSIALSSKLGGVFGGVELGARLRRPSELFGLRVGSQAILAAGGGYELPKLRLSFALELYVLSSLIDSGSYRYWPAEWLLSTRFAPRLFGDVSLGLGGGGGLPFSSGMGGARLGFGLPSFRGLLFFRLTPPGA